MSDDEVTLGMSVPLDSDGFLRRECPTCEREFKWLPNSDDETEDAAAPDGGYFCPYCGIQAPDGQWFTKAQIELAQNMVATQVVGPMLDDFTRGLQNVGRRSGGLLSVSGRYDAPDEMDPLTEVDDMRRADFECHPSEPVKVLDDWDTPVRCLICGEAAS
jgi:DNA-directed RNA polymerase subunit RPC12/RpoP